MQFHRTRLLACLSITCALCSAAASQKDEPAERRPASPGLLKSEFIYDAAPFPSCHASTIAQLKGGGLAVAFFGGSDEGEKDVGIWLSLQDAAGGAWSAPVEVATGVTGNERFPCWNPVLVQPVKGPLLLFYKVGPRPSAWWGMLITSEDDGKTWSKPVRLPEGILGPVKNKPVQLEDGTLVCGSSTESDDERDVWHVHVERTSDLGRTWQKSDQLNDGVKLAAIQPAVLSHPGGKLHILCRTKQGKVAEAWSDDAGKTWQPLKLVDALPNPDSGIDAVKLKDGTAVLIHNHTRRGRTPLNVSVSKDGKAWKAAAVLETEPGEYSYPAVIQTADGKVHVTYTWHRKKIRHAVLDPAAFVISELQPAK